MNLVKTLVAMQFTNSLCSCSSYSRDPYCWASIRALVPHCLRLHPNILPLFSMHSSWWHFSTKSIQGRFTAREMCSKWICLGGPTILFIFSPFQHLSSNLMFCVIWCSTFVAQILIVQFGNRWFIIRPKLFILIFVLIFQVFHCPSHIQPMASLFRTWHFRIGIWTGLFPYSSFFH